MIVSPANDDGVGSTSTSTVCSASVPVLVQRPVRRCRDNQLKPPPQLAGPRAARHHHRVRVRSQSVRRSATTTSAARRVIGERANAVVKQERMAEDDKALLSTGTPQPRPNTSQRQWTRMRVLRSVSTSTAGAVAAPLGKIGRQSDSDMQVTVTTDESETTQTSTSMVHVADADAGAGATKVVLKPRPMRSCVAALKQEEIIKVKDNSVSVVSHVHVVSLIHKGQEVQTREAESSSGNGNMNSKHGSQKRCFAHAAGKDVTASASSGASASNNKEATHNKKRRKAATATTDKDKAGSSFSYVYDITKTIKEVKQEEQITDNAMSNATAATRKSKTIVTPHSGSRNRYRDSVSVCAHAAATVKIETRSRVRNMPAREARAKRRMRTRTNTNTRNVESLMNLPLPSPSPPSFVSSRMVRITCGVQGGTTRIIQRTTQKQKQLKKRVQQQHQHENEPRQQNKPETEQEQTHYMNTLQHKTQQHQQQPEHQLACQRQPRTPRNVNVKEEMSMGQWQCRTENEAAGEQVKATQNICNQRTHTGITYSRSTTGTDAKTSASETETGHCRVIAHGNLAQVVQALSKHHQALEQQHQGGVSESVSVLSGPVVAVAVAGSPPQQSVMTGNEMDVDLGSACTSAQSHRTRRHSIVSPAHGLVEDMVRVLSTPVDDKTSKVTVSTVVCSPRLPFDDQALGGQALSIPSLNASNVGSLALGSVFRAHTHTPAPLTEDRKILSRSGDEAEASAAVLTMSAKDMKKAHEATLHQTCKAYKQGTVIRKPKPPPSHGSHGHGKRDNNVASVAASACSAANSNKGGVVALSKLQVVSHRLFEKEQRLYDQSRLIETLKSQLARQTYVICWQERELTQVRSKLADALADQK
jgi:hypothetical protein